MYFTTVRYTYNYGGDEKHSTVPSLPIENLQAPTGGEKLGGKGKIETQHELFFSRDRRFFTQNHDFANEGTGKTEMCVAESHEN